MTDQLTAPTPAPEGPQPPAVSRLPRALSPFRHTAYRRLGSAAGAQHLRRRRVGRGAGVGGHPDRRRREPAVRGVDGRRRRRAPPGAARWRGRRPGPAEADPAGRRGARAHRHGGRRAAVVDRPDRGVAPRGGVVRDRHGAGVLLPGLLRVAAGAGARGGPDGGQRVRGHGAADGRPGARARVSPAWSSAASRRRPRWGWRPASTWSVCWCWRRCR